MADSKLPDLPPSPKKRINQPAATTASDSLFGGEPLKDARRLSQRAGPGTTIRPMRDTDVGGIQAHDVRTAGMVQRGEIQPRDVKTEDTRYWNSVRASEQDLKAGRDPYDTVRKVTSTRSTRSRR